MRSANPTPASPSARPLRLWPGVLIVALQWTFRFVVPWVVPDLTMHGVLAGLAGGLLVLAWWAFFSRAPGIERWSAVALVVGLILAMPPLLHESIATGMMGMMFALYAVPVLSLALVIWAAATRHLAPGPRRAFLVATLVLAAASFTLFRTEGVTGLGDSNFEWRWTPTPEERLLARTDPLAAGTSTVALDAAVVEWPGFRGPRRDGVVRGSRIGTAWTSSPPSEIWRRPVGPGWSSFAVAGDRLFTQEQRGEEEVVSCYDAGTGEPIWQHADPTRFWESNAGAGPRGTPALGAGRILSLGATGLLDALDAADGSVLWSRNAAAELGIEIPGWGFSGSPLLFDDLVVVALGGRLAAWDVETGEPRWKGPDGKWGYSSPHPTTIGGVEQILLMSGAGATAVEPTTGTTLWEHPLPGGAGIVQPAPIGDDSLISLAESRGMRRIAVAHSGGSWDISERWESRGLKPYFNDFVVHGDHAYGFDGGFLSAIDLATGKRAWKGGRLGHGQLLLLPEQDLLLVLSEKGEIALVRASPEGFLEIARMPALEGKTWNHPVVVGDRLFVRNDREMAAFHLPGPDSSS